MNFLAKRFYVVSVGMAMFSMFFGAGNVVFPLMVGQVAQDKAFYAILGLVLTAVGVPFIGLFGMTLFDGNYRAFFNRLGKGPGFLIALLIMGLIGPFGAIPRCITLSYSTLKMFFSTTSLLPFSIISCLLIFVLTIRKSKIMEILGYALTPFLILSLAVIIIRGIFICDTVPVNETHTELSSFMHGLVSGYHTMDLLGAFFFCAVVIDALKQVSNRSHRTLNHNALLASCIGASLLAIVYIGMSVVAAFHSGVLQDASPDVILGTIALHVLGPYAGIITCVAVSLACLTTAIALSAVFAEFIHYDILKDKINYEWSLIATLVITCIFSTLEFSGIVAFLGPIVQLLYPSLLVLSLVNIAYKLWGFQYVKLPVALTFAVSLLIWVFNS